MVLSCLELKRGEPFLDTPAICNFANITSYIFLCFCAYFFGKVISA